MNKYGRQAVYCAGPSNLEMKYEGMMVIQAEYNARKIPKEKGLVEVSREGEVGERVEERKERADC